MSEGVTSGPTCDGCKNRITENQYWYGSFCYCQKCNGLLDGIPDKTHVGPSSTSNTMLSHHRRAREAFEQTKSRPVESDIDRESRQLWLDVFKRCSLNMEEYAAEMAKHADAAVAEFRKRFDPEYKEHGE